ncbi:MAG: hypothetical protein HQM13_15285 [SAR324 cluster bacterium]|nr:hypothetical protein [SAR324 cluster bacterium]
MLFIRKFLPFSLLSFFLAVFVWYLAKQGAESVEISFFVPLVFKNLPPNMQITSDLPSVISVSGRITRRHSSDFNPAGLQAVVDLTNAESGIFQYTLKKQNIPTPDTVTIVQINPSQVDLFIEEIAEKTVTIRPRFQGQMKSGKILQGIDVEPNTVRLTGPKTILETVDWIFTSDIDLENINQTAAMIVRLNLPNPKLQFLNQDVDAYIAHIKVANLPITRKFEDVAIYLTNQTYITLINPKTFTLYVEGPEEILKDLDSSQLYGSIDLSNYEPGSHKVQPEAVLPQGIETLQQWPIISLWVKPQKLQIDENSPKTETETKKPVQ